MVLESTMICVDNSDYMRNGDFIPSRLHVQQDAVHIICRSKLLSNLGNAVGLITLAEVQVLTTLTKDIGRVITKLHYIQPNGEINLIAGIKIAQLALKHREGKNHKKRIVILIGSPVLNDVEELMSLAKKLKREKVSVDCISLGENDLNTEVLKSFINVLNEKDDTSSNLLIVPSGRHLSDMLIASPIVFGEVGRESIRLKSVDNNEDPGLTKALLISARSREEEANKAIKPSSSNSNHKDNEVFSKRSKNNLDIDFANMTEEEQFAYAMKDAAQFSVIIKDSQSEVKNNKDTNKMS